LTELADADQLHVTDRSETQIEVPATNETSSLSLLLAEPVIALNGEKYAKPSTV